MSRPHRRGQPRVERRRPILDALHTGPVPPDPAPAGPSLRIAAELLTWAYALGTVVAFGELVRTHVFGRPPLRWLVDGVFHTLNIPVTGSFVAVVGLGVMTLAISQRKRIALATVAAFQVLGMAADVSGLATAVANLRGPIGQVGELPPVLGEMVALLVSMALAVLAIWLRPVFPARVNRGSWGAALVILGAGLATALALTHVLLRVSGQTVGPAWEVLTVAVLHALGLPAPYDWDIHVGRWIPLLTSFIVGASMAGAVWIFLRSARLRGEWRPENEITLRGLIARWGDDDSLAYYATRRDKMLYFSDNRRAAIAYRVVGAVCLASGDPVGDPRLWPDLVRRWEAYARTYGWTPAVLACSEAGARAYGRTLGHEVLNLGDEAVLDPERFRLDSTSMTSVRRAARHARHEGLHVTVRRTGQVPPDELAGWGRLATRWREGRVERGFAMALGRYGDPADSRCVLVTAEDADGTPQAMLTFVPWGGRGLSLDLMRRAEDAPHGVVELMVSDLMAWCRDNGISRVSLNFAFLRKVFADAEQVAANPLTRLNSRLLGRLDRFWQVERLYRNNARYRPQWVPRYVCVPSMLSLLPVALACLKAEGFLPELLPHRRPAPPAQGLDPAQLDRARAAETLAPPPVIAPGHGEACRPRLDHLRLLREAGMDGWPLGAEQAVRLAELPVEARAGASEAAAPDGDLRVVARIRRIRDHGGVVFADLIDGHRRAQAVLEASAVGAGPVRLFARAVDEGDLVGMTVRRGCSRTGTPSLLASSWRMLAKAVRPVPWDGLKDPAARAHDRSVDLLVHPLEVDELASRSRVVAAVRSTLSGAGFQEVETPILQTVHGGAAARPFRTTINAYGADLVLRIAPELPLKRLLVGGLGPIFELGRNFRNEGADATHNPEFTVVEAYQPLADYAVMRTLAERLVRDAARALHGAEVMPANRGKGPELTDISGPWPVRTVSEALSAAVGRDIGVDTDLEDLLTLAHRYGVHVRDGWGPGAVIEALYGELVESHTVLPTFYIDFPAETSPLAGPHRTTPGLAERWDLVAAGMELGTAYSELTDPLEQRRRLVEQSWKAAAGDPEAMEVDEDFLAALEVGMPPTGGLGIGIDRLVMALTGRTIREVVAFPFVRPGA